MKQNSKRDSITLGLFGVICFMLFLAIQLPARWMMSWLPPLQMINITEMTGSIWHGQTCATSPMLGDEGVCGHWQFNPQSLIHQQATWQIEGAMTDHFHTQELNITITLTGWSLQGSIIPEREGLPLNLQWLPKDRQNPSSYSVNASGGWQ